jgi:hypothetical protein
LPKSQATFKIDARTTSAASAVIWPMRGGPREDGLSARHPMSIPEESQMLNHPLIVLEPSAQDVVDAHPNRRSSTEQRVGTGLEGITEWHICDRSRRYGGQASDQVNQVGQASAGDQADESGPWHAAAAKSAVSHARSPTPNLQHSQPEMPQQHSQICR